MYLCFQSVVKIVPDDGSCKPKHVALCYVTKYVLYGIFSFVYDNGPHILMQKAVMPNSCHIVQKF